MMVRDRYTEKASADENDTSKCFQTERRSLHNNDNDTRRGVVAAAAAAAAAAVAAIWGAYRIASHRIVYCILLLCAKQQER
jgi:hypothetical protein